MRSVRYASSSRGINSSLDLVRPAYKLLLLLSLAACGAPGSDSVFTQGNPKSPSANPAPVRAPPPEPIETRAYAGYYRKSGKDSRFLPCGTTQLLEITGPPVAQILLRERHRWNAMWEGAKLFAVFRGTIVTDTVTAAPGDSVKPGPRKRFYLVEVDSMRNWEKEDCNGMRIPAD